MELTINSKTMKQPVCFYRSISGYIHVDLSGTRDYPVSLGYPICDGGTMIGRRISYAGESDAEFARICRNWFKSYLRRAF